jgi:hypothetical protein
MLAAMNRALLTALVGLAGILAGTALAQTSNPFAARQPLIAQNSAPAAALPTPKRLGGAESWVAYTSTEKAGQICYVVGQPSKSEPVGLKREVHLLVTHNKADKTTNVVSFIAGYKFKDGSDAELSVGEKKFDLFTKDDTAWARDAATDKAIVDAMLKGKQAVIKGTPAKGAATIDTYALVGFAQVIVEIDKACNIKR